MTSQNRNVIHVLQFLPIRLSSELDIASREANKLLKAEEY